MIKSFKDIVSDDNTLMIVDALNMCFSFRGKTDFADSYVNMVTSLKRSYKAKSVILACDKGSSSFRKTIYPEYKQNRKDKFEAQTEQEKKEFEEFFKEFEKALDIIRDTTEYEVLRYQGVEADDIAGYLVSKRKALGYDTIWLISSDRDWDLLLNPSVHRFSYVTRKEYSLDNWDEHYDFCHDDYMSIKCLMGDSGDNIIGVPGVGPKRAQSLIEEYGSVFDIIQAIPLPGKYKYIAAINDSADLLELNHKLVDIETFCDEAIGEANIRNINERLGL